MTQAVDRAAHAETPAARPGVVVAVLAFSGIVVSLMQTLVIPLVPELPRLLDASAADTSWAITATLLAAAIATPTVGRLGDMYGKRRMLLFSIAMLIAGSVVAALSSELAPMVVGRALQGFSSGVIPLGISIMRDELPAERVGSAIALMSGSLGVGGALGLPLAALLAEQADWHVLFWTSAGLGVVAGVLVLSLVPESRVRTGGRFDVPGALGMSVGLLCLLLGISKGADWGWGSGTTLGCFGGAVVVLLVWGFWELRAKQPLVDLRTTARRQVLLTNIASIVFGFAMFAQSLVLPQLLQLPEETGYGLGQTILVAGLVMAPGGLVMMAMAPLSARISRTMGPKVTLMAGAFVVAAGYALGLVLMSEIWQLVVFASVISAGVGLAYGALPALVMAAVPVSETAAANSLNTLMRSIGTSMASAIAGVVLAQLTTSFAGTSVPSENGFRVVLVISAAASLAALVIAAFLPSQRRARTPDAVAVDAAADGTATVDAAAAEEPVEQDREPVRTPGSGEVTGVLRTDRGAAVEHAVITVTAQDGRQVHRTRPGSDGAYAVTGLPPGSYTVIASAEGLRPAATSVAVNGYGAVRDFTLAAMRRTGRLRGVVVDPEGRAVEGATVCVTDDAGEVAGLAVSGAGGEYEVAELEHGDYAVVTSMYEPTVRTADLTIGGRVIVDLELVETHRGGHRAAAGPDRRG